MTSPSMLEAGRVAVAAGRWADAVEYLAQVDAQGALAAPDLDLLSTSTLMRGDPAAAVDAGSRAYAAHLEAGDQPAAARTAGWLALEAVEIGDFSASVVWSARAMRLVRAIDDPGALADFVRLGPGVAQLGSGNAAEACRTFEEIRVTAERHGDRELDANASLGLGKSLLELGAVAEAFASYDRAMEAVSVGAVGPVSTGVISCAVISDALMALDLARATEWTDALDGWCRGQPGLVTFSGQRHALRAALQLVRGAWDDAAGSAELALVGFHAGDYRAAYGAPYYTAEVRRLRGAFHSAEESYRRAAESGWDPQPGLALLHLVAGRPQQAQAEIRTNAAGDDRFTRRFVLPAVVEIELAAGDLEAADRALRELRESSTSMPTPLSVAVLAAAEARLRLASSDPHGALEAARAAVAGYREVHAPYDRARAEVVAGRALLSLGDRAAAEAEFGSAREVFTALGAAPALAELTALTGDRRGAVLTLREVEVLRLVSTGLTNRGIAERLTLSERTVERHLSNIFGKLGISSRAAATAYAYENGYM